MESSLVIKVCASMRVQAWKLAATMEDCWFFQCLLFLGRKNALEHAVKSTVDGKMTLHTFRWHYFVFIVQKGKTKDSGLWINKSCYDRVDVFAPILLI